MQRGRVSLMDPRVGEGEPQSLLGSVPAPPPPPRLYAVGPTLQPVTQELSWIHYKGCVGRSALPQTLSSALAPRTFSSKSLAARCLDVEDSPEEAQILSFS